MSASPEPSSTGPELSRAQAIEPQAIEPQTIEPQAIELELQGRNITFETGRIARLAKSAVLVRQNDAVVLVTLVCVPPSRPAPFLPLTVEYREKAAAAGRIPGSFMRREGRITDHEVVVSRIIDRSIRPLFPKGFHHEVQVQATVLSADVDHAETAVLGLLGAGAALHLSSVPFAGPLAAARVVRTDGQLVPFPTAAERARADVDLVVSFRPQGLVMLEGGARDVPDAEVLDVLLEAQELIAPVFEVMEKFRAAAGMEKDTWQPLEITVPSQRQLLTAIDAAGTEGLRKALDTPGKHARSEALSAARETLLEQAMGGLTEEKDAALVAAGKEHLHRITDSLVRERVLEEGRRMDGRGTEDIRAIECEAGWLPSPHGSALFTRGETQAMVSCTLASHKSEQSVETLAGMEVRRFLLHYNFPPYSVGEARALRGPGRREIGHGTLALRALEPILPAYKNFPYVIRLESDIAMSNGSSSMATVCGGCLALMDAGVPIAGPVAGIAMGLIGDGDRFRVLSDILGEEDHLGDMDFKVAGTVTGITALQMDNKIGSLSKEVLIQALEQARRGRLHILAEMEKALGTSRDEPKEHAPRATPVKIAVPAISELIGPRGATIKEIQAEFDVQVTIDDKAGRALVYGKNLRQTRGAIQRIQQIAGVVQEGGVYTGKVVSVTDFGAFVKIFKNAEGLVHISEWDDQHVEDMSRVTQVGAEVEVKVMGADSKGRLQLSRRAAQS